MTVLAISEKSVMPTLKLTILKGLTSVLTP